MTREDARWLPEGGRKDEACARWLPLILRKDAGLCKVVAAEMREEARMRPAQACAGLRRIAQSCARLRCPAQACAAPRRPALVSHTIHSSIMQSTRHQLPRQSAYLVHDYFQMHFTRNPAPYIFCPGNMSSTRGHFARVRVRYDWDVWCASGTCLRSCGMCLRRVCVAIARCLRRLCRPSDAPTQCVRRARDTLRDPCATSACTRPARRPCKTPENVRNLKHR